MISSTRPTRWQLRIWPNCGCTTKPRGKNESGSIFPAAPPRNSAGDTGAHLARGVDDDFCDRHRRASWDSGHAEALAFETNPRRGKYCGDDPESRAIRISATSALARRTRRQIGDRGAYTLCAASDYPQHFGGNYGSGSRGARSGARNGNDGPADPLPGGATSLVFDDAGRN